MRPSTAGARLTLAQRNGFDTIAELDQHVAHLPDGDELREHLIRARRADRVPLDGRAQARRLPRPNRASGPRPRPEGARKTLARLHKFKTIDDLETHVANLPADHDLRKALAEARRADHVPVNRPAPRGDTTRAFDPDMASKPRTQRGAMAQEAKMTIRELDVHYKALPDDDAGKIRWVKAGAADNKAYKLTGSARRT